MFVFQSLLFGLALPLIVARVVLALAMVVARKRGAPAEGVRWGVVLGVGAGDLVLHLGPAWRPAFPPIDVIDRTPWLALAATIFALLAPGAAWVRRGGLVLLAALVFVVILGPVLPETSSTRAGLAWLGLVGAVVLVAWAHLEALGKRVEGAALIWPLLVVAGGTSVVLLVSGSVVLSQLGLALTAALAAPVGASLGVALGRSTLGIIPVVLTVLTALVLNGHVYAGLPTSSALLLAAAPAGAWAARRGPARRGAPWLATLLAVVATLVPIGAALGFALAASPSYEY
jgi:hypothetical protein